MSRRRPAMDIPATWIRFTVECDGKAATEKRHPVRRIARVTLTPSPDDELEYHVFELEYVRADDDVEDNDYTFAVRDVARPHMTRRFVCKDCMNDVPIEDAGLIRLGRILGAAGQMRARLREIS